MDQQRHPIKCRVCIGSIGSQCRSIGKFDLLDQKFCIIPVAIQVLITDLPSVCDHDRIARVSLIVPAHNAAPHIESAIASVRAQTYSDWELIVVDDGSHDATWELLQAAAGPHVRALRTERATGPAAARNLALAQATGELVAFLDADHLLLPRYLESQLARYESASRKDNQPVGLVACDAHISIDGQLAPCTHVQRLPDPRAPLSLEPKPAALGRALPGALPTRRAQIAHVVEGLNGHAAVRLAVEATHHKQLAEDIVSQEEDDDGRADGRGPAPSRAACR